MILATTNHIEGKKTVKVLGLVRGNSIRARHLGRDIVASLRNLIGGEIPEYGRLLSESREESTQRMVRQAEGLGANAVVGIRFQTAAVMQGAAEMLAYGTAVVIEESDQ